MKSRDKYIVLFLLFFGWFMTLIKHFWILPTFNDVDHDITGFEFRIKFNLPNGKKD